MTRRGIVASAAAGCWVAIFAGVALIAIDPGRGWVGVTVIMAGPVGGSAALAWLRKGPS